MNLIDGNKLINPKVSLRSGGSNSRGDIKTDLDYNYYFEKQQTDFIFRYLQNHLSLGNCDILDACSGDGTIGISLLDKYDAGGANFVDLKKTFWIAKVGGNVQSQEFGGQDFLTTPHDPERRFNIIVCNPPWNPTDRALAIYEKCLSLLSEDGVFFFLINLPFIYQGRDRYNKLKFQKLYCLPRTTFDTPRNRKLKSARIMERDNLTEEQKQKKIAEPVLLDCGMMVYHPAGIPSGAVNIKPIIPLPKYDDLINPKFPGLE